MRKKSLMNFRACCFVLTAASMSFAGMGAAQAAGTTRTAVPERYQFESFAESRSAVIAPGDDADGTRIVSGAAEGALWAYEDVDFGTDARSLRIRHKFQDPDKWGAFEVYVDDPASEPVAHVSLMAGQHDGWTTQSVPLKRTVSGRHKVLIRWLSGTSFLNWFEVSDEPCDPGYASRASLPLRDVMADTWVATDGLGRKLPLGDETGAPRERKVGIFYFLWHDHTNGPLYDHYAAYLEGGSDKLWEVMAQGPLGYAHYWARPYLGYYRNDDEWVIRKHANQLVNAGVDFVFFDNTNNLLYPYNSVEGILKVWQKMRDEGQKTPQVVFFCSDRADFSPGLVRNIYNLVYKDGLYKDLWFMWDGKPLLLTDYTSIEDPELLDFFTLRRSWAFNGNEDGGKLRWNWMENYPQNIGRDAEGNPEQVVVACGFHATTSRGRSYHGGKQPSDGKGEFEFGLTDSLSGLGLNFEEQWSRALEVAPPVVMLTGWNEWWAGRWENSGEFVANTYTALDRPDRGGKKFFKHLYVDCFNPEFSRDIEAMSGGFGDNYYWQMVANIRKYKGARCVEAAFGEREIDIDASFAQWDGVGPEYLDNLYETLPRDCAASVGPDRYVNSSGRNDFDRMKVSVAGGAVSFYVQTRGPIREAEGRNWMNLFIDSDQDASTGWHGYDYIINRTHDGRFLSVEKNVGGAWEWEPVGRAVYRIEGNRMMLSVPAGTIGVAEGAGFDFKWADNSVAEGDVMQFMDLGDAAPDERFNYRYRRK